MKDLSFACINIVELLGFLYILLNSMFEWSRRGCRFHIARKIIPCTYCWRKKGVEKEVCASTIVYDIFRNSKTICSGFFDQSMNRFREVVWSDVIKKFIKKIWVCECCVGFVMTPIQSPWKVYQYCKVLWGQRLFLLPFLTDLTRFSDFL